MDASGDVTGRLYGVWGPPTVYIVDRKGLLRARGAGGQDWSSPAARGLVEALLAERPGPGTDELIYTLHAVRSHGDGKHRAGELEQAAAQLATIGSLLEVAPPPLRIVSAIEAEWRQLSPEMRGDRRSPAELYERTLGQIRSAQGRRGLL